MNQQALSSLIWSVADLLRGNFKQSECGRVILPFMVLRRLDCVLAGTKEAALAEYSTKKKAGIAFEPFVKRKTGLDFYSISPLDMPKLMGDQDNIRANLESYIDLGTGEQVKICPGSEVGGGGVHDKTKVLLAELIAKVNDLFEGDLTPGDKLVYVNDVIKGKLMESEKLREQAANNTKEQFANSPDLASEIVSAVMGALDAHTAMTKQALESQKLRADLKDVLLGEARLWEGLRESRQVTVDQ
jgi:hypothetical protein